ncbi:hypothetical protein [Actinoplanes siamensis]|uniref:Lipoprotein n=1 Tax=Actinoplanes siamensis TaxID=1223317 RepID=A0A919NAL3_9ACTN|nr:hypothetical protein [Actinoplanes siamensis]GIF07259.1 hypothetical protein Asi03nite_47970 [Actinoplanes siamensis]
MRFAGALGALALTGVVAGCTSSPSPSPAPVSPSAVPASAAPAWTEPASYSFLLTRGCDEAAPLARYQATVRDGRMTTSARVGGAASPGPSADVDLGPVTGDEGEEIEVPTLGELVDMAQTAADDGGRVSTVHDTADGHPVRVVVNVSGAADGDECWIVSDYHVG